jgi:hypothetical protein
MAKQKRKRTDRFLVAFGPSTPQILEVTGPAIEEEHASSGADDFVDYMGGSYAWPGGCDAWPTFGIYVWECTPAETNTAPESDKWAQYQRYQEYDYSDGELRELTNKEWAAFKTGEHLWEVKSLTKASPSELSSETSKT